MHSISAGTKIPAEFFVPWSRRSARDVRPLAQETASYRQTSALIGAETGFASATKIDHRPATVAGDNEPVVLSRERGLGMVAVAAFAARQGLIPTPHICR